MGNTSTTSDYDSMDEAPRQIFDLYKNVNFPDHSDVMGDLPLTPQAFRDLMTIMNLEDFETRQLQPLTAQSIITALTLSELIFSHSYNFYFGDESTLGATIGAMAKFARVTNRHKIWYKLYA